MHHVYWEFAGLAPDPKWSGVPSSGMAQTRREKATSHAPVRKPEPETLAAVSTRRLRTSSDPLYVKLRALLTERGIRVDEDVLANLSEVDADQDWGVVVTQDLRVFTFTYVYGVTYDADDRRHENFEGPEVRLDGWTEITHQWWVLAFNEFQQARELLGGS